MDRKSKILITVFTIIMTASVIVTFYRYIILEDIVFYVDEEAFQESLLEE
ncbi:hypothetical protein GW944_01145 [Candidatus Parcubacteria bacterium]|nr:hypothetical protein [Candidatus Parcubacteria bacterium]